MNKDKGKILEKIVLELIKAQPQTRADLACFKRRVAKKYKIHLPKNTALLKAYHKLLQQKRASKPKAPRPGLGNSAETGSRRLEGLLRKRPVRSLSGVVNVSVLTKPWPCPGKCIFCPE